MSVQGNSACLALSLLFSGIALFLLSASRLVVISAVVILAFDLWVNYKSAKNTKKN